MSENTIAQESVAVAVADGIATITLSRPERGNALDLATACRLKDAVVEAVDAPGARAIVLRGSGKRFCVGGDLQGFRAAEIGANLCDDVARPLHDAIEILGSTGHPVICLVHGAVGGGAVGLVLAADIVIAAESTSFRLGYTGSGLVPDCGVTWELPHRVGIARAMDLALTNRRFTATQAAEMGIVSRVVADDRLDDECGDVLAQLALVPVETLAETKRLIRKAHVATRHDQLDEEAVTIGRIGDTADTREAIAAFLDKRTPRFSA
jgi:2-(1,2-epoxy-1,2-dihydrophenyl)acetyl-CoA isomerase